VGTSRHSHQVNKRDAKHAPITPCGDLGACDEDT
jgi:hypothetical protein